MVNTDELLEDVLLDHLLLGAVRLHARWRVYALSIGEWTLDYLAYEGYGPDEDFGPMSEEDMRFRNGLYRVDEHNADAFCEAIQEYEIPFEVLKVWIDKNAVKLLMLADFDERRFVHGYSEPIEPKSEYIPTGWTGIVGDPLDYVSEDLRRLWSS